MRAIRRPGMTGGMQPGQVWWMVACFVQVPLALALVRPRARSGDESRAWHRMRRAWWPVGAVLAVSFLCEPGPVAASFAAPWLIFAFAVAGLAVLDWMRRGFAPWTLTLLDLAGIWFAGSAVWLFAQRAGISLLGFDEPWVTWTAAHFLVLGVSVHVVAGVAGSAWPPARRHAWLAVGLALSLPVTALGIQFSPWLERIGAWLTAASACWLAVELLVQRRVCSGLPRRLLDLAAVGLLAGMVLAFAWTLNMMRGLGWPDVQFMAQWHAGINSLVFGTTALAALALASWRRDGALREGLRARGEPRAAPPLSRLIAPGRITRATPRERGWLDSGRTARGLVDRLEELAHADFDAATVHPTVRAFYEDTAAFDMELRVRWARGFRWCAPLWGRWSARHGQMNFPRASDGARSVRSELLAIRDELDGRPAVRAWLRSFRDDDRVLYCATYSVHRHRRVPLMNIAFPFGRANVSSILRVDGDGAGGVIVTTCAGETHPHRGVYLRVGPVVWRTPMQETIRVHAPRDGEEAVSAEHQVWLFGLPLVRLEYLMQPRRRGRSRSPCRR